MIKFISIAVTAAKRKYNLRNYRLAELQVKCGDKCR